MTNKQIYGILAISLLIIIPLYMQKDGKSDTKNDQTASVQAPCVGQVVTAAIDPSNPPNGTIAPGQTNAHVMSIRLSSTVCPARLESLTLSLGLNNTATTNDISSVGLYSGNVNIGNFAPFGSSVVFNLINASYATIPQNGSATFDIKVNVKPAATFGHVLKFRLLNSASLGVVNTATGAIVPVGGSYPIDSNNHTIALGTSQPDLLVTSLKWRQTPNNTFANGPLSQSISGSATFMQFTIKNNGTTSVTLPSNSVIRMYKTNITGQQTTILSQLFPPLTIAGGGTQTAVIGMSNGPLLLNQLGNFLIKIEVDPANAIAESNEGNNTLMPMPSVTITP